MSEKQPTRRELIKKAVYTVPAILTLPAVLSIASAGSDGSSSSGYSGSSSGGSCKWYEFWCNILKKPE